MILENLAISYESEEFKYLAEDWRHFMFQLVDRELDEKMAKKFKSCLDQMKQAIAEVNEVYMQMLQPKAEMLGQAFGAE